MVNGLEPVSYTHLDVYKRQAVDGKVAISCGVTNDYVKQGVHAGKIVKEVASICGGGGGGRPDMAQAGAKDASKINEALQNVDEWLKNNL